MPEEHWKSALLADHQQLKQQIEELRLEHQRLRHIAATRAERRAHRMRLRCKRLELEEHYQRLRQIAETRHLVRQHTLADINGFPGD